MIPLFDLPIGTIIVICCLASTPAGWTDITGTPECAAVLADFQKEFPQDTELRIDTMCIKKKGSGES